MELIEIVEKAREDYNLSEMREKDDKFICEVNEKITIEFRNNNIVRKRKKKQYKYVLDVNCGYFGKGCVFNEYEEIKDIDNNEPNYSKERYISGARGVAGDIGVIVKYKALLLQVGYTSILTGKFGDTKWHHDPYIGLGISIHKNKKRN